MALQPRIIACGNKVATFAMAVRFLTGPAVMAAASFAVGLRGTLLHVAIVQVLLTSEGGEGKTDRFHNIPRRHARLQQQESSLRCFLSRSPSSLVLASLSHLSRRGLLRSADSTKVTLFSHCAFFFFFASPNGGTSRQLCPRALSPSSSQRSTTCTLTFSAPRKFPVSEDTSTPRSVQRFSQSPLADTTGACC
jgi:hypothetical protein